MATSVEAVRQLSPQLERDAETINQLQARVKQPKTERDAASEEALTAKQELE